MKVLPAKVTLLMASVLAGASATEILQLTDVEYQRLPKLVSLDHYQDCLTTPGAVYCLATFQLTADEPSPLYDLLKNLSAYRRVYYNHTLVHRGVCVTAACARHLTTPAPAREAAALAPALQACVAADVRARHGLRAQLAELVYCRAADERAPLDALDYAFAAAVAALLTLNLAGTLYDVFARSIEKKIQWLAAFSVRVNWNKLTVLRGDDYGDPRLNNLRAIQGMRTLSMFLVICGHVLLIPLFRVPPENSHFVERLPFYALSSLLHSGLLFMQTFMVMASFLLAYNLSIFMETQKKFGWGMYFVGILQRFLRLVPTYMLVVWYMATWSTRVTSGPLCPHIDEEKANCRDKWWLQLFFLHNLIKASDMCLGQAWYLAVDMQLFLLGLLLLKLLWGRQHLARRVLGSALALATLGQVLYTYALKLQPPQMMQNPEVLRTLFKEEHSFWLLYTVPAGNVQGYLLGLLLGLEYYRLETFGDNLTGKKWFRWAYQLCFPLGFMWMVAIHPYLTSDHPQIYVSLYAAIDRLFFAALISIFLLGMFRSADSDMYRGLLAWRGWQATGRLTYGALLLHILVYMNLSCSREYARTLTFYGGLFDWIGTVVVTYLLAVPLTLMVEYPFQSLVKNYLTPAPRQEKRRLDLNGNLLGDEKSTGCVGQEDKVKKIQ